jgi:predicted transcriptional regulator
MPSLSHTDAIKEQLFNLLSKGLSQESAALSLGVTPGYISQLLTNDKDLADKIAAKLALRQVKNLETYELVNKIQSNALEKLDLRLPTVTKVNDLLNIIKTMQGVAAVNPAPNPEVVKPQTIININLPAHLLIPQQVPSLVFNAQNQAVSASSKTLIPMQSSDIYEFVTTTQDSGSKASANPSGKSPLTDLEI